MEIEDKDELSADEIAELRDEEKPIIQLFERLPIERRGYFSIKMEDI